MKRIAKPSKANEVGIFWISHKHTYNRIWDKGKWLLFISPDDIDEVWERLVRAFENHQLSAESMKVSTRWAMEQRETNNYVICVYTSLDEKDIMKVREELRALGFTKPIPYKTNEATLKGIYGKGSAKFWV